MKNKKIKKSNIFLIGILAIAGMFGVSSLMIDKQVKEEPVVEKADAAASTNRTIRVYVNLTFGSNQSGTINSGSWTSGTSTSLSGCNYYWQTTSATASSTTNTFNFYFKEGSVYWHPYSGSKDNDTNYSRIANNLVAGHAYKVDGIGYEYQYNDGTHKWFHFTVTDIGSISDTTTTYFDPGASYSSYSAPYCYYTEIDGVVPYAWHGTAMTKVDSNHSIYGGYRWRATVASNAPVIVFNNNNTAQTDDLTRDGSKTYLLGTGWVSNLTLTTNVNSTVTTYHIYSGVSFTLPTLPSAPTGYTAEWNTAADGSGTKYTGTATLTANTTLYSYNRPSTYTITYNRNNGGSAPTATQNKTHGVSYSIANPTAFSWSPSDMKYFKYWSTKSDDSGTKYYVGDSYTTNAALGPLYYIEDYWDFQVKCGSGSYSAMTWDTGGGLPEGVKGQFGITMDVTSGQSLTFQVNKHDGNGWQTISPTYSASDNNYADGAILADATGASIWLKIKNDNSYDAYVSGYTPCAVVVGGTHHYPTTKTGEDSDAVYDTEVINIDKDQTVAVSWNHIVIDTYLNGDSTSGCFSGSAGTVTCTLTGAYTIRVHNNGYGQHNTVYITRDDAKTGKYLAQIFNNALSGVCQADGSTNQSALTTAWNGAAAHFTGEPSGIKALFVIGSSDSDIANMMNRYKYVIQKYGTSVASDFLGKGYKKSAIQVFSPLSLITSDESSLSTVIIIVSSSVALLSITALSILVIKKRKQKDE